MARFIIYDFEVFTYDWLVVFKYADNGEYVEIVNDKYGLSSFYNKNKDNIFVGWRSKGYDRWIMQGIIEGYNPKTINDKIVKDKASPYSFIKGRFKLSNIDISDDLVGDLSLKEIEANLGLDIEETPIDFDIDRKLTDEEIDKVLFYCRHDVDTTEKIFYHRKNYVQSKINLIKKFDLGLEEIGKTQGSLAASILKAKRVSRNTDDGFKINFPKELQLGRYSELLNKFSSLIQEDFSLSFNVGNIEHFFGVGGLHGSNDLTVWTSTHNYDILILDFASYYPYLMRLYSAISRNVPNPQLFNQIIDDRIVYKKKGDPLADAYKLVINVTFGCMWNKMNSLYDSEMGLRVCVLGQLFLVDLIDKIIDDCILIQSNTDGIVIKIHKELMTVLEEAIKQFESRTKFKLEKNKIDYIFQKDVNNYVAVFENGSIKVKGAMVKQYERKDKIFRNNLAIVDEAVVNALVFNKSPKETIMNCKEIDKFQMIAKSGHSYWANFYEYEKKLIKVQKVNRVFASTDSKCGVIYKQKGETYALIPNLPKNCFIYNKSLNNVNISDFNLDYRYYINMTWLRLSQFLNEKNYNYLLKIYKSDV